MGIISNKTRRRTILKLLVLLRVLQTDLLHTAQLDQSTYWYRIAMEGDLANSVDQTIAKCVSLDTVWLCMIQALRVSITVLSEAVEMPTCRFRGLNCHLSKVIYSADSFGTALIWLQFHAFYYWYVNRCSPCLDLCCQRCHLWKVSRLWI